MNRSADQAQNIDPRARNGEIALRLPHDITVVVLQGMRVRSGTNFLAKFVSYHPEVALVPGDSSTGEFRLLASLDGWRCAFDDLRNRCFGVPESLFDFETFAGYLGESWLSYLINEVDVERRCLFLKDPSVSNLSMFPYVYPRAKLIVLIRDGRDNVASCLRAGKAVRRSTTLTKRLKQSINSRTSRDFIGYCRAWAEAARDIIEFERRLQAGEYSIPYLRVRYEDLFDKPIETGRQIFQFMEVELRDDVLEAAASAPVVGSSFYSKDRTETARKPNWRPTEKTSEFNPVGRWSTWSMFKKAVFKRIAGAELVALGYEQSHDW